ncbi:UNVERIFIED_CONTAM: Translation initiation factor eIF-2B subunit delta [Sesamum latifolium]|uniref:Translation initiation factor eIF2B subunit delta n=1 Tax=Sesamum latifolium TaxID=2727402 RepID=A0AAW2X8R8_9LAMI
MDSRRVPRTVSDPKVRQVGFFAPAVPLDRSESGPPAPTSSSPPVSDVSPSGNSLSPVMIPPPRHLSTDLSRHFPLGPPISPLRVARAADTSIPVGSYNPSEFLTPTATTEFSEDPLSPRWGRRGSSGKFATSLPAGGFDMALAKQKNAVNLPPDGGSNVEVQKEQRAVTGKPLKEKTTKAERRALQEAQRAAKAAAKGEGSKMPATAAGVNTANSNAGKPVKAVSQKKDSSSIAASEKKGGDRQPDKDRKKDVPHPRMQFDDANRVEKAKKRSVVKQTEAKNRVELFRHLPQYEHGTQLPELESKFFQLDTVHPAVYKVGLRYLAGDISGGNARCIAMLQAFQESIKDYSTPPEKSLIRDLTTKINGYVSFLIECRPLSISMGNAIRFLKTRIAQLPLNLSESEAKVHLISDIDRFISEKIILADKVIVKHAVTKIRDGDVLLTYASSSAVELILLHAHELGKQFRVVIVDSRPKLEGQKLLRRLVGKGLALHVLRWLPSVSCPVLICCEAYKFHERVQLDSICSNELGDPDAISKVSGRKEINTLDGWANSENLQLLNLMYDATPSDYVSMIITDYGMIPPTSVPVIVGEYRREHLWI